MAPIGNQIARWRMIWTIVTVSIVVLMLVGYALKVAGDYAASYTTVTDIVGTTSDISFLFDSLGCCLVFI
jgi:hypothetical protein